ncbi:unnamed protein product [Prunus brigantina]
MDALVNICHSQHPKCLDSVSSANGYVCFQCIRILKKCREAIPEDKGNVIIVEAVIDEKDEKEDIKLTNVRLMLDMVMMAHTNTGKERTLKEWGFVLGEAGFSRHTITPIHAAPSVIQAFP